MNYPVFFYRGAYINNIFFFTFFHKKFYSPICTQGASIIAFTQAMQNKGRLHLCNHQPPSAAVRPIFYGINFAPQDESNYFKKQKMHSIVNSIVAQSHENIFISLKSVQPLFYATVSPRRNFEYPPKSRYDIVSYLSQNQYSFAFSKKIML